MAPIVPDFVQMAVVHAHENANATIQLPNGPSTLSFNKDDFASGGYKVDEFIAKHRRAGVPLETLKEDLGLYLDVLETAMYDLINRDYQDFVSLSSNLVGLDTAIEDLSSPLNVLKQDVSVIQGKMKETLKIVDDTLTERNSLRDKRLLLERFLAIEEAIHRLQSLLGPTKQNDSGDVLEEAALKWVSLQIHLKSPRLDLDSMPFVKERKATMDVLGAALTKKTAAMFAKGLDNEDVPMLRQAMRIYVIVDEISEAEDLFRKQKVAPQLSTIFDECVKGNTKPTSEILTILYAKILDFIPSCLSTVKEVISSVKTSENRTGNDGILRGFDFVSGSVWPEIANKLTTQVDNLFSPGNPDMFHANYTVTLSFLTRLEGLCTSQACVKKLRSHPSHKTFLSKWNLSVYFQIRFQEIAGTFETALLEGWKRADEADDSKGKLKATSVLLACLNVCWISSVFLDPLLHKFWKLTLQLLSRYATWMSELKPALEMQEAAEREGKPSGGGEKSNGAVASSGDVPPGHPASTSAAPSSTPTPFSSSSSSSPSDLSADSKLVLIVDLMSDVATVDAAVTPLFETLIWPRLHVASGGDAMPFRHCLDVACGAMKGKLEPFIEFIIGVLFHQSTPAAKQVNDVPRKYRKTNREVPSKPSPYVASLLEPLKTFTTSTAGKDALKERIVEREIVSRVLKQIVEVYLRHVADVLTSVQKMEESLKRLKKARGGGGAAAAASAVDAAAAVSDDDKIRLQLALDVKAFSGLVDATFHFDAETLEHFVELETLVVEAAAGLTDLVA